MSAAVVQRGVNGVKILLDIAKESSDWFPPLKSALGGVSALIKHYEVSYSVSLPPAIDGLLGKQRCQRESQAAHPVAEQAEG